MTIEEHWGKWSKALFEHQFDAATRLHKTGEVYIEDIQAAFLVGAISAMNITAERIQKKKSVSGLAVAANEILDLAKKWNMKEFTDDRVAGNDSN